MNYLIEAVFVGIATVIVGLFISFLLVPAIKKNLYKFLLAMFLTGFFIHVLCEISGINKWYCRKGYACRR